MLYPMKRLLRHAEEHQYAVGYFEAFNMDCMLAVLTAAEQSDSPVIIGFGGQFVGSKKRTVKENIYHYGAVAAEAAKRSPVPCAVILNEADDIDMVYQGMNAGFNAVMYQKPGEDFDETVRITREICCIAHYLDVDVESEVGELPCADIATDTQSDGSKTDIEQALRFVEETGVDALAVAIGNVHLLEGKTASLDFGLLKQLHAAIPVPLVLHGGTGVSADEMKRAIAAGITKVNVGTVMKREYINAIKAYYDSYNPEKMDPHCIIGWGGGEDMLAAGRSAITNKVKEFIDMFDSAGKAVFFR
jgi:ketose-bisphosphate aldolase